VSREYCIVGVATDDADANTTRVDALGRMGADLSFAGSAQLAAGFGGPGFTSTRHIRQLPAIERRSW
ncbi:MAG: hypothetical protein QGH07_05805, partial [Alphaproteobacteria bacterium]|nr:hypothetical protein [Alphaproteobacteria bacterium]